MIMFWRWEWRVAKQRENETDTDWDMKKNMRHIVHWGPSAVKTHGNQQWKSPRSYEYDQALSALSSNMEVSENGIKERYLQINHLNTSN